MIKNAPFCYNESRNKKTEETNMIKIGVMGAYRGKSMIDVLMYYKEAALVAVCDRYRPALEKVRAAAEKAEMEVALYTNFEDFIQHDMDAVILANYADEHAPFAIRCLEAGKHVMSEVLPAETMAQAVALIEAVEKSGKVYTYAENYCYMQDAFEIWKRYESGDYGDIVYAECEYVHDCASVWPQISYGDKDHWRNRMHPNFYCTHSLGPILAMTHHRPVKVVGYELPQSEKNVAKAGLLRGAGLEMVTLDNGAVVKSLHGGLKREPSTNFYQVYCQNGVLEGERSPAGKRVTLYREDDERLCVGTTERYEPQNEIMSDVAKHFKTHNGSDFYAPYVFIQRILGRPDGKWALDVYRAVDMGICGILAYRSVLNGNIPIAVPNLRNREERDAYRHDNACTNPRVAAGDELLPITSHETQTVPDELYERVRTLWKNGLDMNGDRDEVYSAL